MLFRKTFRNALATLLGMALALATGAAHAEVNMDALGTAASPVGTNTVSLETLFDTTGRTTTVGGVVYYRVTLTSGDGRVDGQLGARAPGGAAPRSLYLRYGLENMVFARALSDTGAPAAGTVRIPDADDDGTPETGTTNIARLQREFGGTTGEDFVVYKVDAIGTVTEVVAAATVQAFFHNELAMLPNAVGSITQSIHLTLADARTGRDPLRTRTQNYATPARSLGTVVTPRIVTATVASGFTRLSATGSNRIGTLTISAGNTRAPHKNAQDGTTVDTLTHVAQAGNAARGTGSLVTYKGDFSVGLFLSNTTALGADLDCGRATLATVDSQKRLRESLTVAAGNGNTAFCINIPATNGDEIPSGAYTVAVDYQGLTNAAFPPTDFAETTLGAIRRDGTRVQIPYLTTFEGYTQRVVIVNRNRAPVTYSFNFVEEDGTTATPGDMAEGSVGANSTLVLKARDIVSLAGKTRTAATLDVVATSGSVDVATTQVNIDSQGTDTVIYESVAN